MLLWNITVYIENLFKIVSGDQEMGFIRQKLWKNTRGVLYFKWRNKKLYVLLLWDFK